MLAALSVDLDELDLYRAVHARVAPLPRGLVYARGLFRALELAQALDVPLTFFVVAADLALPGARAALCDSIAAGHAVESHSRTHPYDLASRPPAELDAEVAGSFDAIEAALGERPRGFRAPGYTVSAALFGAVARAGATFDASILPSPAYYGAKLAVLAAQAVRGRKSASIAGAPGQWFAPRHPWALPHVGPSGRPLLELPIATTRRARIPVIGTSLGWGGPRLARRLARAASDGPLVSLELHGVDFLERADAPGLDLPELTRPLAVRLEAVRAAVDALRAEGRRFVTLRAAAGALGPSLTSPCI